MSTVDCGEEFREKVGEAAANLFQLSVLLLSNEEEAVSAVESFAAKLEVNKSGDCKSSIVRMTNDDGSTLEMVVTKENDQHARLESKRRIVAESLKRIAARGTNLLAVPDAAAKVRKECADCEDLSSSGISPSEFVDLMHGTRREQVRQWLDGLDPTTRIVFVLRASAGFSSAETVKLLTANGGSAARGWTPSAVSNVFRAGLCSLAAQVIHGAVTGK
jgi:hypothetical protein